MKINAPNSTTGVSSSKRKAASRSSGDNFSLGQSAEATAAMSTTSAASVQSVDAILALQSVGDFTEARKQATSRAHSLLDVLDELKLALLDGGLPKPKLESGRDETHDAGLEAALDEVETRAAVELAKFD
jgi:hypothetical protein